MNATVLGRSEGSYHDLPTLLSCLRASMLVPGIAGELVGVSETHLTPFKIRDHLKNSSHDDDDDSDDDDDDDDDDDEGSGVDDGTRHAIGDIKSAHSSKVDGDSGNNIPPENERRTMKGTTTATTMRGTSTASTTTASTSSSTSTTTASTSSTTSTTSTITSSSSSTAAAAAAAAARRSVPHKLQGSSIPSCDSISISMMITTTTITPLVDAFLVEPMPYRSAAREGATHMIVLRSKPDPVIVMKTIIPRHHPRRHQHDNHQQNDNQHPHLKAKGGGIYENIIASRFFLSHQLQLPRDWLLALKHQHIYQSDRKLTYH